MRPELLAYIASRLRALQIETDEERLRDVASLPASLILLDGHGSMTREARKCIPRSWAQWELGSFFKYALPPAVFDLYNGPIESFEEFAFLYDRILGSAARPWLRSLFLAAASSPSLPAERRLELVSRFDVTLLDFDEKEEARQAWQAGQAGPENSDS